MDGKLCQIGVNQRRERLVVVLRKDLPRFAQVATGLLELLTANCRKRVNERGLRRFVRHAKFRETRSRRRRAFCRIIKGVQGEKYLCDFVIAPRDKLRAAKLNELLAGLIMSRQSGVVVAAQKLQIGYVKLRLRGPELLT